MIKTDSKLGTLASNIFDEKLFKDQNSVKVVTKENINNFQFSEATSFMRIAENKNKIIYQDNKHFVDLPRKIKNPDNSDE